MEFKHLRYFIAAVEEGSLQAAALRLHVAQPALSRRVRDLETELGCQLLERSARGVIPTRAGLSLYREAIRMLDELNEATQHARRLGLEQDREIRIGLAPTTPRKYSFVQQALSRFSAEFPDAGIAYSGAGSTELVSGLRAGSLDMALLYEQHPASSRLEERLVHRERYVLAAYPAHGLATQGPAEAADLAGEKLVWLSRRNIADSHNPLLQQLRRHGVEPVIGQLVDSPEEQIDLVTAGAGICLTPCSTILTVREGQLVFRSLPGFGMELDLTLGWSSEAASPASGALLEGFHRAIDAHQAEIASGKLGWAMLDGRALLSLPDRSRPGAGS